MEALGIDSKLLIAQAVNFVLFFYIFKRFIAKPFFSFLESAQKKEKEKERIMAELKSAEDKAKQREKELLQEAKDQAAKMVSEAKKTALFQKEELLKKAHEEALEIKSKAQSQLNAEKAAINEKAKSKLLTTSALIAKIALKDYIDSQKQEELVTKILAKTDYSRLYEN